MVKNTVEVHSLQQRLQRCSKTIVKNLCFKLYKLVNSKTLKLAYFV